MCRGKGRILGGAWKSITKNPSGPLLPALKVAGWEVRRGRLTHLPELVSKMDRGHDWQAPDWHPIGKGLAAIHALFTQLF
jgi:hypothetical protein